MVTAGGVRRVYIEKILVNAYMPFSGSATEKLCRATSSTAMAEG